MVKHWTTIKKFARAYPWQTGGAALGIVIVLGFGIAHFTETVPARGGTFIEGTVGDLQMVNPVLAANEVDKQVSRLVFSPLKDLVATSSISFTKTQQVRRVTLRDDAVWHDGEPVTTEDVLFTVSAIKDPQSRSPLAPAWGSVTVERVGERELAFTVPVNYGLFENTLLALEPLPRHVYQAVPYGEWSTGALALAPVGSGPYAYDHKTVEEGRVTEYFLKTAAGASNPPNIRAFTWKFFETSNDLVKEFNRGGVHGMVLLDPDAQVNVHAPHATTTFDLQNYYAIFANPSKNESLRDMRVRKALQNAIDKDKTLAVAPGSSWFLTDTDVTPQTSAALLEMAGWKKEGAGWTKQLDKSHTAKLEAVITVPDVPFLKRTAEKVAEGWESLGVPTRLEVAPIDKLTTDIIPNRTYELLIFGNVVSPRYDLFPFWHSAERFHPGLNLSLYNNAQTDGIVNAIRTTTSQAERERLFNQARARLASDAAAIFLYQTPYTYITGGRVEGVEGHIINESAERFDGVRDWYVKTKRVWK